MYGPQHSGRIVLLPCTVKQDGAGYKRSRLAASTIRRAVLSAEARDRCVPTYGFSSILIPSPENNSDYYRLRRTWN